MRKLLLSLLLFFFVISTLTRQPAQAQVSTSTENPGATAWTPMNVSPGLQHWTIESGAWTGNATGMLALQADGGPARIMFNAPLGVNYQMQGEYSLSKAADGDGIGIVLGQESKAQLDNHIICRHTQGYTGGHLIIMRSSQDPTLRKRWIADKVNQTNTFVITVQDGLMSIAINGRQIIQRVQGADMANPGSPWQLSETGKVGFYMPKVPKGTEVRISRLAIRRPPPFQPGGMPFLGGAMGATSPKRAGTRTSAEIQNSADLLEYLEDSVWAFTRRRDEPPGAHVTMHPRNMELSYFKDANDRARYAITTGDKRTLSLNAGKLVKFNDSYTEAEVHNWPRPGEVRYMFLRSLSGERTLTTGRKMPLETWDSAMADTRWNYEGGTMTFHSDGLFESKSPKKQIRGEWFVQSETEVVVQDENRTLHQLELSADSRLLIHCDQTVWTRNP